MWSTKNLQYYLLKLGKQTSLGSLKIYSKNSFLLDFNEFSQQQVVSPPLQAWKHHVKHVLWLIFECTRCHFFTSFLNPWLHSTWTHNVTRRRKVVNRN